MVTVSESPRKSDAGEVLLSHSIFLNVASKFLSRFVLRDCISHHSCLGVLGRIHRLEQVSAKWEEFQGSACLSVHKKSHSACVGCHAASPLVGYGERGKVVTTAETCLAVPFRAWSPACFQATLLGKLLNFSSRFIRHTFLPILGSSEKTDHFFPQPVGN